MKISKAKAAIISLAGAMTAAAAYALPIIKNERHEQRFDVGLGLSPTASAQLATFLAKNPAQAAAYRRQITQCEDINRWNAKQMVRYGNLEEKTVGLYRLVDNQSTFCVDAARESAAIQASIIKINFKPAQTIDPVGEAAINASADLQEREMAACAANRSMGQQLKDFLHTLPPSECQAKSIRRHINVVRAVMKPKFSH